MRTAPLPFAALLAVALFTVPLAAQTPGSLAVRITAKESGAPLPGAQVTFRERTRVAAGADGWARVENVPPGQHLLQVRHIGYVTESFLIQVASGAAVREEVVLEPAPVELAPVAVEASRPRRALESRGFYARRRMGQGTFMDRDDLEAIGRGSSVYSVLWRLPGARLAPGADGRGTVLSASRRGGFGGPGTCMSQIIIDGMVMHPLDPKGIVIEDLVSLNDIEAIEWYRGPAQTPPQYNTTGVAGSSASCGTLVIWTRTGGR